ncbi:MAG TPA: proton-conducting transporter membrane subunit [Candidatus Limnocylindrales bacterium]|nr:proton-conducting transporter membrane subunit [Candidatus Limnocylindrales bacterium]
MVLLLPLLVPVIVALVVLAFSNGKHAAILALAGGCLEIMLLINLAWQVHHETEIRLGRYFRADGLTSLFLMSLGFVFFVTLLYSISYIRHVPKGRFSSPRWFYCLTFLFFFTMLTVYLSENLGLLWIMMEATTLSSALLVGFYNTEGAIEAGWKYLVVCTVGIAFALFGTIALYLAAVRSGIPSELALNWTALVHAGPALGQRVPSLVKLAFLFVAVGYGTKVGFVPMHSWLPDAHAEAPSPISAMLSAALLNCAMYALLRYDAITVHALGPTFSHTMLLIFGALSLLGASLLMVVQRDLKRLFAYSSVEHMGMVATGIGIGVPLGVYGALLHSFNHSAAKSLLFFAAGNVRENFGTLRLEKITGMARSMRWTSIFLAAGVLAIIGMPPFSLFVSEFAILNAAFARENHTMVTVVLLALVVGFGALIFQLQRMLGGDRSPETKPIITRSEITAMALCAGLVLALGVHLPGAFVSMIHRAMAVLIS